jgi:hypothetical protein
VAVRHARRGVHVHAGLEELLVDARQRPEIVVALNEQSRVRSVQRQTGFPGRRRHALGIIRKQRELGVHGADRDGGEGEQAHPYVGQLCQQLVSFARTVFDRRVEVVRPSNAEGHGIASKKKG